MILKGNHIGFDDEPAIVIMCIDGDILCKYYYTPPYVTGEGII